MRYHTVPSSAAQLEPGSFCSVVESTVVPSTVAGRLGMTCALARLSLGGGAARAVAGRSVVAAATASAARNPCLMWHTVRANSDCLHSMRCFDGCRSGSIAPIRRRWARRARRRPLRVRGVSALGLVPAVLPAARPSRAGRDPCAPDRLVARGGGGGGGGGGGIFPGCLGGGRPAAGAAPGGGGGAGLPPPWG